MRFELLCCVVLVFIVSTVESCVDIRCYVYLDFSLRDHKYIMSTPGSVATDLVTVANGDLYK